MTLRTLLLVQVIVLGAFGAAYALRPAGVELELERALTGREHLPSVEIPRSEPLTVSPLFDREDMPEVVSEEEVAYALKRIRPRFDRKGLRPNLVEHALRTWGVAATFEDPTAMSGAEMELFLTDHGQFTQSWGESEKPLLEVQPEGISIRYGRTSSGSVHHDHWLACLTEAGVHLDTPVYGPGRRDDSIETVLREALRDFKLDEREAEWTAMAFGLWLPPTHEWIGAGGRRYSFDLIATRLMRGECETGVCVGTHRVYSLVLLMRLDDEFPNLLSDEKRAEVNAHLEQVRDWLRVAQFPDGHWPGNWPQGADAVAHPREDKLSTQIIATGHHLEWQAIAPAHLRLSDEQNRKAVEWLLTTMRSHSNAQILQNYTFYTHVGNAFALWRKTSPTPFWRDWTAKHPGFEMAVDPSILPDTPENTAAESAGH
ncbi:MAG: hypothetical protein ACK5Q5_01565 [Planctomycetaceae bacterium]